jgi:hypothetical protein
VIPRRRKDGGGGPGALCYIARLGGVRAASLLAHARRAWWNW